MMNVILNADDLGLSDDVNGATFDLMSRGLITSATIMANGPSVLGAIEESRRFPSCSFGVHLNLTEFRPFSRHDGLRELLDDDGKFNGDLDRTPAQFKASWRLLSAIADEWCHQIEFIGTAGVQISHLDSHQHVHTIPFVFPVLKYVQAKYGIRKVRSTRNAYRGGAIPSRRTLWAKRAFQFALTQFYRTKTTAAFMDFATFYERVVVAKQQWSSVEAMVHPGSSLDLEENRLLYSDWRDRLGDAVRLISYADL
jgi:chitin disaccharide deacetylase